MVCENFFTSVYCGGYFGYTFVNDFLVVRRRLGESEGISIAQPFCADRDFWETQCMNGTDHSQTVRANCFLGLHNMFV